MLCTRSLCISHIAKGLPLDFISGQESLRPLLPLNWVAVRFPGKCVCHAGISEHWMYDSAAGKMKIVRCQEKTVGSDVTSLFPAAQLHLPKGSKAVGPSRSRPLLGPERFPTDNKLTWVLLFAACLPVITAGATTPSSPQPWIAGSGPNPKCIRSSSHPQRRSRFANRRRPPPVNF